MLQNSAIETLKLNNLRMEVYVSLREENTIMKGGW